MNSLYNISIQLYVIAIRFAALFNAKAKLWVNGRKNIFQKIEEVTKGEQNIVWFHCASLGEFEQGRPLIEKIRSEFPDKKIVLSFFSPSGYEIRKNYEVADVVCYLPLDSKKNAKQFLTVVHPSFAIFVKYEFWPNLLKELQNKKIKTITCGFW